MVIDTKVISLFSKLLKIVPKTENFEKDSSVALFENGVIVVDANTGNVCEVNEDICNILKANFSMSNRNWIKSFHKSWNKVMTESYTKLLYEQMVHYMFTYGREYVGKNPISIVPAEKVLVDSESIPSKVSFTLIKAVDGKEYIDSIKKFYSTVASPKEDYVKELAEVMSKLDVDVNSILSYELKVARYDQLGEVPVDGQDFLRYMVYKTTGNTVLIKNYSTIKDIKYNYNNFNAYRCFKKANLIELSKVFYRFKPIFLAFKTYEGCPWYINKIRKLANKYHEAMSDVNVQNFSKLMNERRFGDIKQIIRNSSNRQLIKLVNFYKYKNLDSYYNCGHIYNIRNGKIYVDISDKKKVDIDTHDIESFMNDEIIKRYSGLYKNSVFYIPNGISYAAPVSEKQFVGNIPYGSFVDLPETAVAAISWNNFNGHRTDLDLHLQSVDSAYGWNSLFRKDDGTVAFSGDMTDASNGAVEAFRVRDTNRSYILTVNDFTSLGGAEFDFILSNGNEVDSITDISKSLIPKITFKFNNKNGCSIGMFSNQKFYFYGNSLSKSIVPDVSLYTEYIKALEEKISNVLTVEGILNMAGATVLRTSDEVKAYKEDHSNSEILDLSISNTTGSILMDVIDGTL